MDTEKQFASVLWKDPLDNKWHGPDPVLIRGRGAVCIYSKVINAARWLPERLVKHIDNNNNTHQSRELSQSLLMYPMTGLARVEDPGFPPKTGTVPLGLWPCKNKIKGDLLGAFWHLAEFWHLA
uniref:Bm11859 n=1 Tax=Brugia malayi TaxID=6279 RepID=A0A1I9GA44_BRUMA|nr:Bm11859 [Brugia malayi]